MSNARNNDDLNTLLIDAVCDNKLSRVSQLLDQGADVNFRMAVDERTTTPLFLAAGMGHLSIVQILLEKGANRDIPQLPNNYTPIFAAAQEGHLEVMKALIQKDDDLNLPRMTTIFSTTLLFHAAKKNHVPIVTFLLEELEKGRRVNVETGDVSPLYIASQNGHDEVVDILLKHGAKPNRKNNKIIDGYYETPISVAVKAGRTNVVKRFLEAGVDPNIPIIFNQDKISLLYIACGHNHVDIVKLLLQYKANPDVHASYGAYSGSPLSIAAGMGFYEIVELLLQNGASPDFLNNYKVSPLSRAAENGHHEIVKLLLEYKADPTIKDESEKTAFNEAVKKGHVKVVKILLGNKTHKIPKNDYLRSFLSAIFYSNLNIVKLLLDANTDNSMGIFDLKIEYLRDLFKNKSAEIKKRSEYLIQKKNPTNTLIEITISPAELAWIMGHTKIIDALGGTDFAHEENDLRKKANIELMKKKLASPNTEEKESAETKLSNLFSNTDIELNQIIEDKKDQLCIELSGTQETISALHKIIKPKFRPNMIKRLDEKKLAKLIFTDKKDALVAKLTSIAKFIPQSKKIASPQNASKTEETIPASQGLAIASQSNELNDVQLANWRQGLLPAFCYGKAEPEMIWNAKHACFKIDLSNTEWVIKGDLSSTPMTCYLSKEDIKNHVVSRLKRSLMEIARIEEKEKKDAYKIRIYPNPKHKLIQPLKKFTSSIFKAIKDDESIKKINEKQFSNKNQSIINETKTHQFPVNECKKDMRPNTLSEKAKTSAEIVNKLFQLLTGRSFERIFEGRSKISSEEWKFFINPDFSSIHLNDISELPIETMKFFKILAEELNKIAEGFMKVEKKNIKTDKKKTRIMITITPGNIKPEAHNNKIACIMNNTQTFKQSFIKALQTQSSPVPNKSEKEEVQEETAVQEETKTDKEKIVTNAGITLFDPPSAHLSHSIRFNPNALEYYPKELTQIEIGALFNLVNDLIEKFDDMETGAKSDSKSEDKDESYLPAKINIKFDDNVLDELRRLVK